MKIIDEEGLFTGDRIARLSDEAQRYWLYFFLASNGYGRLEINYRKLLSRAFCNLRKPPTEDQVMGFISEYAEGFLLFLYRSEGGQVWGQWDCSAKYLPRYATAADQRSPAPPIEEFNCWKDAYIASKRTQVLAVSTFSEICRKLSDVSAGTPELTPELTSQKTSENENLPFPATISENSCKKARVVVGVVGVVDVKVHTEVSNGSRSAAPQQPESARASSQESKNAEAAASRWLEFRQMAEQRAIKGTSVDWDDAWDRWQQLSVDERIKAFRGLAARPLSSDQELRYRTNVTKYFERRLWQEAETLPVLTPIAGSSAAAIYRPWSIERALLQQQSIDKKFRQPKR